MTTKDPIKRDGLSPEFWKHKPLKSLTSEEWEALCDGCGKCCLNKLEDEDKLAVEEAIKETLDWLDDNQNAEKEEYEDKLKEMEAVCNPIVSKVYQQGEYSPSDDAGDDDFDDHDEL